jgi:hypothetical protein
MPLITLENTRLELRRGEKDRFRLFFDGKYVPGVLSVNVSQDGGSRPEFTITFGGSCIRVVERPDDAPDCDGDA